MTERIAASPATSDELRGLYIEDLKVGQTAVFAKTVTETDIILFAGVTGDLNPVHLNDDFAAGTVFKGRVAHGMLSVGFISAAIGTRLPGPGSIYLSQNLRFRAPVRAGDTVTARVTVTEIMLERKRAVLQTVCSVRDTVVIEGEATVLVPSRGG
jgi:3-hydroxybutyryl-CoA dehydratase